MDYHIYPYLSAVCTQIRDSHRICILMMQFQRNVSFSRSLDSRFSVHRDHVIDADYTQTSRILFSLAHVFPKLSLFSTVILCKESDRTLFEHCVNILLSRRKRGGANACIKCINTNCTRNNFSHSRSLLKRSDSVFAFRHTFATAQFRFLQFEPYVVCLCFSLRFVRSFAKLYSREFSCVIAAQIRFVCNFTLSLSSSPCRLHSVEYYLVIHFNKIRGVEAHGSCYRFAGCRKGGNQSSIRVDYFNLSVALATWTTLHLWLQITVQFPTLKNTWRVAQMCFRSTLPATQSIFTMLRLNI